jgi:predicted transcriptional regulator
MAAQQSPHQGTALKQIVDQSKFSVVDLTKMLEVSRKTIYLWFEKEVVPHRVIDRVGNALGVDIPKTMPKVFGVNNSQISIIKDAARRKSEEETAYWKDKYLTCMEKVEVLRGENDRLKQEIEELKSEVTAVK